MNHSAVVQLETTHGVVSVELYDEELTGGVSSSFLRLAISGQLEGKTFASVVPGVGVVGGANGAEEGRVVGLPWGSKISGYDDIRGRPALRHVGAGLLTCRPMDGVVPAANFLVTLAPLPRLDKEYVIFGRITSGMTVIERIAKLQVDESFRLFTPVSVMRCAVVQQPQSTRPGDGHEEPFGSVALVESLRVKRVASSSLLESL